jgi:hypothetical protein
MKRADALCDGIGAVVTWRATMNDGRLDVQDGGPFQDRLLACGGARPPFTAAPAQLHVDG